MIRILALIGVVLSGVWFFAENGYEPIITCIASLITLVGAQLSSHKTESSFEEDPRVEIGGCLLQKLWSVSKRINRVFFDCWA